MRSIKLRTFFLSAIVTILLFSACSTIEYFNITVLEPAEISFTQRINTFLLVSNCLLPRSDSAGTFFISDGEIFYDSVFLDSALSITALGSLQEFINSSGRFQTVLCDTVFDKQFPKFTEKYTIKNWLILRDMCDSASADAVIMLNFLKTFDKHELYSNYAGPFYIEHTVSTRANWLVIDPAKMQILDETVMVDTFYFSKQINYFDFKNIPTRYDALEAAAIETGLDFGYRITPYWAETSRVYFRSGSKNIRRGYKLVKEGNWKKAAYFWREELRNNDPKERAKACFNLAVAGEMEGLLEPAISWAEKSYNYFPDTLNKTYISILKERLMYQKKLLLQMEGR